jgi:hypothetical protein
MLVDAPALASLVAMSRAQVLVASRSIYSLLAAVWSGSTRAVRVMPHMWQARSTNDAYKATTNVIITRHDGHIDDDQMMEELIHHVLLNR